MSRVAILTPDPSDPAFPGRWGEVLERMVDALTAESVDLESRAWTDAGDLRRFDLVMPLTVWGYHRAGKRWPRQVDAWERERVPLRNPPTVLRWNADKRYLGALAKRGAPIVPTLYAKSIDERVMVAAAERLGVDRLVAKPQVSAGAYQTLRWSPGDGLTGRPEGAAMIQPYLSRVEHDGEVSLFYFSGDYSHAVRKVPRVGDFRVQPEYDAVITAHEPAPDEWRAAEAVLRSIDETLLYARVDLVRDLDGRPVLIELELIEPDLYLGFDPRKGAGFAKAVAAAAQAPKKS